MSGPANASNSQYEILKSKCQRDRKLFEDADFPAIDGSIYPQIDVPVEWSWKRPKEIHKNAKFIIDGASRFDLVQGNLGDCWFIAAAATLATRKELFSQVVPSDQSFYREYHGIFRFNFWRFGRWEEVVIDDRLPVDGNGELVFCRNRNTPNEYWGSLLEKAYAKINGSYQAIRVGYPRDALVDFTGGISETYNLRKEESLPPNLFDIIINSSRMGSLLGAGIGGGTTEEKMWNGLYKGHAYSVTKIIETRIAGWPLKLIRLRNPWGMAEWTGAWSDKSDEWASVPDGEKLKFGLQVEDDGEFWMSYDDFKAQFHILDIVHMNPDLYAFSGRDVPSLSWEESAFHGRWIRGVSAGGCGVLSSDFDLYYTNPQYQFHLEDVDEGDVGRQCTCVISLMLKDYRKRKIDRSMRRLFIGFDVHQVKDSKIKRLDGVTNIDKSLLKKQFQSRTLNREITCRLQLDPGVYCVIPNTMKPHQDGEFLLRIFTYSKITSKPLEENTDRTDGEESIIRGSSCVSNDVFCLYAGPDHVVDARDLRELINYLYKEEFGEVATFSLECCRSLLAMKDGECIGLLDYGEFVKLWDEIVLWRQIFLKYDKDKSGSVEFHEIRRLLKDLGYKLSTKTMSALAVRYGGKYQTLSFEDFVFCSTKLITMYALFDKYKNQSEVEDRACLGIDEWLWTTMYY